MGYEYSDESRESDEYALPNIEVFQLTAHEVAAMDEDLVHEYMQHKKFRLASMNSFVREAMLTAICEEEGIKGGWFWQACFPGCLPDGEASGPYKTYAEALKAARDE